MIDNKVEQIYSKFFRKPLKFIVPAGESSKDLSTIESIIRFLVESGIDRQGTVIGIGGGVTCDIAGFAATIYLRGIQFGFMPTTLLAMCDASIGGKNGINFHSAKNIIGTFNSPEFNARYLPFLDTLTDEEFANGMAEVIKHAIIEGNDFMDFLSRSSNGIKSKDPGILNTMVDQSIQIKSAIVNNDLLEKGERKKLNLGHTLGHAIEVSTGLPHGQAVSIGLVLAARIANRLGICNQDLITDIMDLCIEFNLPVKLQVDPDRLISNIVYDKKRKRGEIDFIFPVKPGKAEIVPISINDIKNHLTVIIHE